MSIGASSEMVEYEDVVTVDAAADLEGGQWGRYQKVVLVLAGLAFAVDGLANQALGLSIPALIKDWGLTRGAFAPVAALSLVGVALGAAGGGILGDRYGRRIGLIISVLFFGAITAATAAVDGVVGLAVLRLLAGLGLGSTIPNATSLVAEFTPARSRTLAVSVAMICIPIGSFVSGLLAAAILPDYGWRLFFAIGGVVPVLLAVFFVMVLPESPRFLLQRPQRHREFRKLMSRLGYDYAEGTVFRENIRKGAPKSSTAALFGAETRGDTLALWGAFFFCLIALYTFFSWGPVMLTAQGFDLSATSMALSAFNLGGIGGAFFSAWAIQRYGTRPTLTVVCLLGAAGAAFLAVVPPSAANGNMPLIISFALESVFIGGFQNVLYPLAAHIYPPFTKATGVGAASALGRIGAVVSSFTGILALNWGGAPAYFAVLALVMVAGLCCASLVKNQIPSFR